MILNSLLHLSFREHWSLTLYYTWALERCRFISTSNTFITVLCTLIHFVASPFNSHDVWYLFSKYHFTLSRTVCATWVLQWTKYIILTNGSCLIYLICVCLHIVVFNTCCVVFLFCFSSSCSQFLWIFNFYLPLR